MNDEILTEYEINTRTMLIMPVFYGEKVYSKVYETEDMLLVNLKPLDIIKSSCEYFGASYEGCKKGTKRHTGKTHKAPIAIDRMTSIFFFPTVSPSKPDCIWVADGHVKNYLRDSTQVTTLIFHNRFSIKIPVSIGSLENQLLRTSHLRTKLTHISNESDRRTYVYVPNPKYMSAAENKHVYKKE